MCSLGRASLESIRIDKQALNTFVVPSLQLGALVDITSRAEGCDLFSSDEETEVGKEALHFVFLIGRTSHPETMSLCQGGSQQVHTQGYLPVPACQSLVCGVTVQHVAFPPAPISGTGWGWGSN